MVVKYTGRMLRGRFSRSSVRALRAGVAVSFVVCATGVAGQTYTLERLGLTDAVHTSSNGRSASQVGSINGAGQVVGSSARYNGTASAGQSAWLYSQGEMQLLGLTGPEYTYSNGYAYSSGGQLNEAGQVIGHTHRNTGTSSSGWSAWLYSEGATQQIGLTGADYTNTGNGYAHSVAQRLNEAGQVIGYSTRYDGTASAGQAAWLYAGGLTQQIGLTGGDHTHAGNGSANSTAHMLNEAGQVIGSSARYNGTANAGQSAWLHSQGETRQIGLTGDGFTGSGGYAYSTARALNDAGQVTGYSASFAGGVGTGNVAWLYSDGATQRIGLTGAGYTNTITGRSSSQSQSINGAGQVIGSSERYTEGAGTGQAAWIYSQGVTQRIGLTGEGYEATGNINPGYASSTAYSINEAGQVVGSSKLFTPGAESQSVWIYSQGATRQIGLTGDSFVSVSGRSYSEVLSLNEAGQVIGYSRRDTGQVAWFFDDVSDQTFALEFSVSASHGSSYSNASYLGEDGLVLGSFDAYEDAVLLGRRAFAWTMEGGMQDLGLLVAGGLDADWASLANAYRGNASGQIIGTGRLVSNGDQGVFLLTPVPEPEGWAMLLAGLGLMAHVSARRWRQSNPVPSA